MKLENFKSLEMSKTELKNVAGQLRVYDYRRSTNVYHYGQSSGAAQISMFETYLHNQMF